MRLKTKSAHYALNPTHEFLTKITAIICLLTVVSLGCILTGCLAIVPPVFAQPPPESSDIDEQSVRIADDERQTLLSLLAIVIGLCLWGGLRFYQYVQLVKDPKRAQELRRNLLMTIAGLDDSYAQGRIREHAYHRKREHLKQRVLDITLRQHS